MTMTPAKARIIEQMINRVSLDILCDLEGEPRTDLLFEEVLRRCREAKFQTTLREIESVYQVSTGLPCKAPE